MPRVAHWFGYKGSLDIIIMELLSYHVVLHLMWKFLELHLSIIGSVCFPALGKNLVHTTSSGIL
jgi:hypothetical protein